MSKWPDNLLARRALQLARKHGSAPGAELWPTTWEFLHRVTGGRFSKISDLATADLEGAEDEQRDEFLRIIIQALETGDLQLLAPPDTFTAPVQSRPEPVQP